MRFLKPFLPSYQKIEKRVKETFSTGILTKGKYLNEFEKKIANYLKVKNAVGVSSGTTGLLLTLRALGLKGEVVVPSFTFMAAVHPLVWNGLVPVFAEIDPETLNIDTSKIEELITPRTSAILAVHLFGNPADVRELKKIAKRYKLKLIFDSAHAFGSLYQGKPLGSYGEAEVFSCSPAKLLITSEGGVVTTGEPELAQKIYYLREYGNPGNYDSVDFGINARMPEFNAILGIESLSLLEENAKKRNQLAEVYRRRLGKLPGIRFQKIKNGNRSSYKDFVILIDEKKFGLSRNLLANRLAKAKIETKKYYDPPVHKQTCYHKFSKRGLPITERISKEILALPIYAGMGEKEIDSVCVAIEKIQRAMSRQNSLQN
ncbi:MAG: DegT/DnrJ/EryC1/StrS family aminotransferase [Candidatus Edwardsbacteria bacterium]